MGATLNRRDSVELEFTGDVADFFTILLYVFNAGFRGEWAFLRGHWYNVPTPFPIVPLEHVARDFQAIGESTGVDRPDHEGGHYFILGAVAAGQDSLDVGLVSRQQLNLERGLAFIALSRDLAFAHYAFRRVGAVLLKPADVDILQQRIGCAVGICGGAGTVEAKSMTEARSSPCKCSSLA